MCIARIPALRLMLAATCALATGATFRLPGATASCVGNVTWNDVSYLATETTSDVPLGSRLATKARIPECNDTGTSPNPSPRSTARVRRAAGINPYVALLVDDGNRRTLYLAEGYLASVASHPAYPYLPHSTPASEGLTCARRSRNLGGTVMTLPLPGSDSLPLTTRSAPWLRGLISDGLVFGRLDPRTRLQLPVTHGLPHLTTGMRVEAAVSVCRKAGRRPALLIRTLHQVSNVRRP